MLQSPVPKLKFINEQACPTERDCVVSMDSEDYVYQSNADADFKLVKRPAFIEGKSEQIWVGNVQH